MKGVVVVGSDGALGRLLVEALGATPVRFRHPGELLDASIPEIGASRVVINVSGPRVWPGLGWADYLREHVGTASAVARSVPPESHLIHVSSAAVYGARPNAIGASTPEEPRSFPNPSYAWAKLAGEHAARAVCRERGVRLSVLRPAMVYGPGVTSAIDTLLSLAARGVVLDLVPGTTSQSCLHVSLLVEVVRRLVAGKAALAVPLPVADPFVFTNADLTRAIQARHRGVRIPAPLGIAEAVLRRWPLFPDRDGPGPIAALAFLGMGNVFDSTPIFRELGLSAAEFSRRSTLDRYLGDVA